MKNIKDSNNNEKKRNKLLKDSISAIILFTIFWSAIEGGKINIISSYYIFYKVETVLMSSKMPKDNTAPVLQEILQKNVGFGTAQNKILSSMFVSGFVKGAMNLSMAILLPIVCHQWAVNTLDQSLGLSIIYSGMVVGLLLQGLADRWGRQKIALMAVCIDIVGLLGLVSWSWPMFIFCFFIAQASSTLTVSITYIYITEITINKHRGSLLATFFILIFLGFFYVCITGYFLLTPYLWKYMSVVIFVPCLVAIGLYCCYMKESLQYLWAKKDGEGLYETINWMGAQNHKKQDDKLAIQWSQLQQKIEQEGQPLFSTQQVPTKMLFADKYLGITVRMMIARLCNIFIYNGLSLFLPTILSQVMPKQANRRIVEYSFYGFMVLVEVITLFVGPKLVNNPEIGRKKTSYWTFAIITAVCFLPIFMSTFGVIPIFIAGIIIKGTNSVNQLSVNLYCNELYEPLVRSKAQMVINMLGRIVMIFLGGIGLYTLQWFSGRGVFLLFGVNSLAATVAMHTMPYCTTKAKE